MGQEKLGDAQPIADAIDKIAHPYDTLKSYFSKKEEKKPVVAKADDRVSAANESFRKRAEAEKAATKKSTPKRSSGK